MKKLILILVVLAISLATKAQGNLQFNQVKRITTTGVSPNGQINTLTTITVPANKVWKIESASVGDSTLGYTPYYNLYIDYQILFGNFSAPQMYTPLWLPSGTYPIQLNHSLGGSGNTVIVKISAIEYNIIP